MLQLLSQFTGLGFLIMLMTLLVDGSLLVSPVWQGLLVDHDGDVQWQLLSSTNSPCRGGGGAPGVCVGGGEVHPCSVDGGGVILTTCRGSIGSLYVRGVLTMLLSRSSHHFSVRQGLFVGHGGTTGGTLYHQTTAHVRLGGGRVDTNVCRLQKHNSQHQQGRGHACYEQDMGDDITSRAVCRCV
jgi:hypothetical protein